MKLHYYVIPAIKPTPKKDIITAVETVFKLSLQEIQLPCKKGPQVAAKTILCNYIYKETNNKTETGVLLNLRPQQVSNYIEKFGHRICFDKQFKQYHYKVMEVKQKLTQTVSL